MFRIRQVMTVIACAVVGLGALSCGESDSQTGKEEAKADQKAAPVSALKNVVKTAIDEASLDDEFMEARNVIEGAGFVIRKYKSFPTEEVAKRGRVLVYTDKQGKRSGGVVYIKRTGFDAAPAWHWYFDDMAPDSVAHVELNYDGLWDIQIVSTGGKVERYIQEDAFTLFARERNDWIAMNGSSSTPASDGVAMWKCFDGDTTTAWKSPLANGAFLELSVPFGVKDGNLTLCALSSDQPRQCTIYADGKQVGQIELQPVVGRQVTSLGQGVLGAKKVRLEFASSHGNSGAVAVAELGLR